MTEETTSTAIRHDVDPVVSVILPTFNRAEQLGVALQSVRDQSYPNLEIIVVDDGSTDETRAMLESVAIEDGRIRPVFLSENRGRCAARNAALDILQGEYIAFIDSDDVWHPWKTEAQLAVFNAFAEVGICWTEMRAVDGAGSILHDRYLRHMYSSYQRHSDKELFEINSTFALPSPTPAKAMLHIGAIHHWMFRGNIVHTPTVMIRRSHIDPDLRFVHMEGVGEDWPFHLAVSRNTKGGFLDLAAIDYQIGREDQATNPKNDILYARAYLQTVTREYEEFGDDLNIPDQTATSVFSFAHSWLASASIKSDRQAARRHIVDSLRLKPAVDARLILFVRTFMSSGVERWIKKVLGR